MNLSLLIGLSSSSCGCSEFWYLVRPCKLGLVCDGFAHICKLFILPVRVQECGHFLEVIMISCSKERMN